MRGRVGECEDGRGRADRGGGRKKESTERGGGGRERRGRRKGMRSMKRGSR